MRSAGTERNCRAPRWPHPPPAKMQGPPPCGWCAASQPGPGGGQPLSPKHTPGQAVDIQSTDRLIGSGLQSGFWTHVSQISLEPSNSVRIRTSTQTARTQRPPCPSPRPKEVRPHPDANGLKWLKLLSLNGRSLGSQTAIVATPGHGSGNSWLCLPKGICGRLFKNCFISALQAGSRRTNIGWTPGPRKGPATPHPSPEPPHSQAVKE